MNLPENFLDVSTDFSEPGLILRHDQWKKTLTELRIYVGIELISNNLSLEFYRDQRKKTEKIIESLKKNRNESLELIFFFSNSSYQWKSIGCGVDFRRSSFSDSKEFDSGISMGSS